MESKKEEQKSYIRATNADIHASSSESISPRIPKSRIIFALAMTSN